MKTETLFKPLALLAGAAVMTWGLGNAQADDSYKIAHVYGKTGPFEAYAQQSHRGLLFAGSIIVATPTFLRSYMRRCTPEQFKTLEMVIAGAERLPGEMCDEFEKKFGVRPVEGYGTTELAPVAAVNVPYSRQSGKDFQVESKEGTVGRPMPNCAARITDSGYRRNAGARSSRHAVDHWPQRDEGVFEPPRGDG